MQPQVQGLGDRAVDGTTPGRTGPARIRKVQRSRDQARRQERSGSSETHIAFGFNAEERKRIDRAASYDSPLRQSFYPLVEWGWTRQDCIDYLRQKLGVTWRKSACVQCPFNSLTDDALARHREHPEQVADAMLLEHVSLSLNPRGTLYRDQGLIEDRPERAATSLPWRISGQKLEQQSPWTVYRVRRLYRAGKDEHGNLSPAKKGNAIRAVERLAPDTDRVTAIENLRSLAEPENEIVEFRNIRYVYRERCGASYPTREEFLVAAPAVVEGKARYGLEWFERQWQSPQLALFE